MIKKKNHRSINNKTYFRFQTQHAGICILIQGLISSFLLLFGSPFVCILKNDKKKHHYLNDKDKKSRKK